MNIIIYDHITIYDYYDKIIIINIVVTIVIAIIIATIVVITILDGESDCLLRTILVISKIKSLHIAHATHSNHYKSPLSRWRVLGNTPAGEPSHIRRWPQSRSNGRHRPNANWSEWILLHIFLQPQSAVGNVGGCLANGQWTIVQFVYFSFQPPQLENELVNTLKVRLIIGRHTSTNKNVSQNTSENEARPIRTTA